LTREVLPEWQLRLNRFRTFSTWFSVVAWLPKWQFEGKIIDFRVLRVRGGESGAGRGLECPRLISGVVGPYLGVGSQAGGQRREPMVGTGRLKTWRAAKFWASVCLWKARGDRIFSVGNANLWFAPGCGNRTPRRRPVLRFRTGCGGLRRHGKLRGTGLAAAKDFRWGAANCDPGVDRRARLDPPPLEGSFR